MDSQRFYQVLGRHCPETGKTEAMKAFLRRVSTAVKGRASPATDIVFMETVRKCTPRREKTSSLTLGLSECLPEVGSAEYIENFLDSFLAVMPGCTSLRGLLREALQRVFKNHSEPDRPPVLKDLIAALDEIV